MVHITDLTRRDPSPWYKVFFPTRFKYHRAISQPGLPINKPLPIFMPA